jgi:hypothetical protein
MIDDFESKIQVKTTLDLLKTPINRIDEFQAFNESILGFIAANKTQLPAVLQTLTPAQNEQLKNLLRTKRISLQGSDSASGGTGMMASDDHDVNEDQIDEGSA